MRIINECAFYLGFSLNDGVLVDDTCRGVGEIIRGVVWVLIKKIMTNLLSIL